MRPTLFFARMKDFVKTFTISGKSVFGDVKVVSGYSSKFLKRLRYPACLIVEGRFMNDREHPRIGFQTFSLVFLDQNKQDIYGENIITGSGETYGINLLSETLINELTTTHTLSDTIVIVENRMTGIKHIERNYSLAKREFTCSVLLDGF